jgi:hypothetical protein
MSQLFHTKKEKTGGETLGKGGKGGGKSGGNPNYQAQQVSPQEKVEATRRND